MHFWHVLTRLGEAQILLPLALMAGLAAMRLAATRPRAIRWVALLTTATVVTSLSKVAFIGWGIGSRALDFTGVSGHAMCAAAVLPVLFGAMRGTESHRSRQLAVACGCALALLIGISRVVVGAHSVSEVIAGLLLGGAVSALVLARPWCAPLAVGAWPAVAAALWLVLMPLHAPAAKTQVTVTQVALLLSGHTKPHTRAEMRRAAVDTYCRCNTTALAPSHDAARRWRR